MKGKVVGYRHWDFDVDENGPRLDSTGVGAYKWEPGRNEARCETGNDKATAYYSSFGSARPDKWWQAYHEAPAPDCGCGLYALYEPEEDERFVAGAILAWGRIEAHVSGFRAQYAEPVVLSLPESVEKGYPYAAEMLRACAVHYHCQVVRPEALVETVEALGEVLPKSERPEKPKPERNLPINSFFWTSSYLQSASLDEVESGEEDGVKDLATHEWLQPGDVVQELGLITPEDDSGVIWTP